MGLKAGGSGIICGGNEVFGDQASRARVFDADSGTNRRTENRFQQQLEAGYDQQS